MAGNIKGITIEFRGDTTKLDKALREIKNSTKDIDKELKNVDRALKFNPKNIDLWRQKQELLRQRITQTEANLKELKNAQAQMDAKGVDKNSEEYRRLQREIIETESKLKHFNSELRQIGNVNLRAMSEQFKDMGNKLTSAGHAMQGLSTAAAAVAASIGALTVKSGKWADDINTMSKVYSIGTGELQKYAAAADLVDVDVETIAKSHVKLEKTMLSASKGTGASAEAFEKLGVDVTDANGNLRQGDAVWQDVIKALGSMENETERDAIAMQLMGKSAAELNPLIEDGGETYKQVSDTLAKYDLDFIDQETLDQANAFNDSIDMIKSVGMVAFQQLGTQLAAYLAPAMEKVVDVVGRLANWFANLSPRTQAIIAGIAAVVAVVAPLLIGLGKVSFAISSIMSLMATLGPAIGGIVAAFGPVILIIGAVVAAGVLLYKNWDTIKAKAIAFKNAVIQNFNDFKAKVVSTFNSIKDAIIKPIQTAIDKVKAIVQKIKGFFPISVGKIFGDIKLPHFNVTGKLSINPPSVPKISIDWYKTGGIFDSPSVIGVGEAGAEAVVPLDKFWDKLDNLHGETNITINVNGANKDPREIAEEVKRVLIRETNQRRLAWQ
jgi:phage-related minor tail protein